MHLFLLQKFLEIAIEALAAGTLTRLLVKEGDSVTEGEVVASVA